MKMIKTMFDGTVILLTVYFTLTMLAFAYTGVVLAPNRSQ
jgi:hypothetical protein